MANYTKLWSNGLKIKGNGVYGPIGGLTQSPFFELAPKFHVSLSQLGDEAHNHRLVTVVALKHSGNRVSTCFQVHRSYELSLSKRIPSAFLLFLENSFH